MEHPRLLLLSLLLLSGCFADPVPFDPPACHPANPDAPQAAFTPPDIPKTEDPLPVPSSEQSMGNTEGMRGMRGMGMGAHHHMHGQAVGNGGADQ